MQSTPADGAPRQFTREKKVYFHHCDPAGVVFFAQYLVFLNEIVQEWFEAGLTVDYPELLLERRIGMPTARVECDFLAPSTLGDTLRFTLSVERTGKSSCHLLLVGTGPDPTDVRARIKAVLVCTSLDSHRAVPLPDDVRTALQDWPATKLSI
ncbi:acyl-CoA thioesterase [Streptomyces sp. NPDC056149]|uniref:acyl-CoA thioesterase n=1 Tax=unclassified Streptomyces TaxID=2593676 RepID=UPI0023811863|nr:thioesterase family protein [Streptomyces sp. WZ-12]